MTVEAWWLGGQRFTNNEELQNAVLTYLSSLEADFFERDIGKLVSRYDKCLKLQANFVEKLEIRNLSLVRFFSYVNMSIIYGLSELEKTALAHIVQHYF